MQGWRDRIPCRTGGLNMNTNYMYMVNNSSSRKRYASPKAGTELYLDLVFRQ